MVSCTSAAPDMGEQTQGLCFPPSCAAEYQGVLCPPCDGAVPIHRVFLYMVVNGILPCQEVVEHMHQVKSAN